jgi:hypothetical protein
MNSFRFIFPDDDEGFEVLEEATQTTAELDDDDEEKEVSQTAEYEVIWETEED